MTAQHHKGKKRPRAWHRGLREDRRWLGYVEYLETQSAGIAKRTWRAG